MKDDIKFKFLTWSNIDRACSKIYKKMQEDCYKPDAIVGLLRGGIVPARIFCDYFNVIIDFFAIDVKLYNGIGTKEEEPKIREFEEDLIRGKQILISDDILDSGKTMNAILEYLKGEDIRTATLYCKESAINKPNYYAEIVDENTWLIFPWERNEFKKQQNKE